MININITRNQTDYLESPNRIYWHNIISLVALPKVYNLSLILRKHLDKLKLKNILQSICPSFLKDINVMKDRERLRYCSRLNEPKEMWKFVILNWILKHKIIFYFANKCIHEKKIMKTEYILWII